MSEANATPDDLTAGEDVYTASEQLAAPPAEIAVDTQADTAGEPVAIAEPPPEDPNEGVPEEVSIADLRTYVIGLRKENKALRVLNMQLMGSVDKLVGHLNNLTDSHNKVVTAVNGLATNEKFLDVVTSYVVMKAEQAENTAMEAQQDAIADALLPKLTILHDTDSLESITENVLKCFWKSVPDNNTIIELHAHTFVDGSWMRIMSPNEREALFMRACAKKIERAAIPEGEEVYVIYNPDQEPLVDTPEQFQNFVEQALEGQGALGEFHAQVKVSELPEEGSVKFQFTTNEDGSLNEYHAEEQTPAGEWVAVEVDRELASMYAETIAKSGDGDPTFVAQGKTWYINHL